VTSDVECQDDEYLPLTAADTSINQQFPETIAQRNGRIDPTLITDTAIPDMAE